MYMHVKPCTHCVLYRRAFFQTKEQILQPLVGSDHVRIFLHHTDYIDGNLPKVIGCRLNHSPKPIADRYSSVTHISRRPNVEQLSS